MPRRDGSGPLGQGTLSGRGLGPCSGADTARYGAGLGLGFGLGYACRRGFGRGFGLGYRVEQPQSRYRTDKELLREQKKLLEDRLNIIDKELEDISDN